MICFCFVTALVIGMSYSLQVPIVRFQTGKHITLNSYVDCPGGLPDLNQFTICLHIKYLHMADNNTVVSYFSQGQDNELSIFTNSVEAQLFQLYCCGDRVRNYIHYPIHLYTWEHLCMAVDFRSKMLTFVLNGHVTVYPLRIMTSDSSANMPLLVRGGGHMVLGQDLDNPEGGFQIEQILQAEIADFVIFDVALSETEMKTFTSCLNIPLNPVVYLDGNMTLLQTVGETDLSMIPQKDLCAGIPGYQLLFPERLDYKGTVDWCDMLKGTVVLPANEKENTVVYDKFFSFRDVCVSRWRTLYYFGAIRNTTTDEWFTEEGSPIVYEKFDQQWNRIVKDYPCASVGNQNFKYTWFAVPCASIMCPTCNFTQSPQLRLRGLCKESLIDRTFFLNDYKNERVLFGGKEYANIFWNNETWVMESRRYKGIAAEMEIQSPKEYPLGRHNWTITGDKCSKIKLELQLTSCGEGEYTCNSGSCIPKDRRCDLVTDCPDLSDELDCDVVNVPEGYSSALPPPKISSGPLALLFSVRIISIREFNLVGFTLVVDAVVTVKWHDSRLVFRNLRDDYHANKVKDFSQLWTPNIFIRDGSRSSVDENLRSKDVYVMLEDQPMPDNDALVGEDDTYSGGKNTLIMETEQTLKFTCQFQLQMYPVDRQNCFLLFTIPDLNKDFGVLKKDILGVKFEGSRRLLEYELVEETLDEDTDGTFTFMKIRLLFKNLYGYYIGNTFVPSLLLVVIGYLTLYFSFEDFQDRIMVSLTSMLVLATFFTQTSATIPRTSYLKLIDAWYVALICENFLVIVSLVVIENIRMYEQGNVGKVVPVGHKFFEPPKRTLYQKVNLGLKVGFPVLLSVILGAFFSFWNTE